MEAIRHQIVNVNINTGDEGNKKKRDLKDYILSIPNVIFNPSLSIPQGYPIVKQETNPPFYDKNKYFNDKFKKYYKLNKDIVYIVLCTSLKRLWISIIMVLIKQLLT